MVSQKNALMTLWKDTFSVTEYQEAEKANGSTGFEEVIVLENQPCKLSFSTLRSTNQTDDDAYAVQITKLFCDTEIVINAGSKITVQHNGRTFEYGQSGEPGVFFSHQEIMLVPFEGWV
jgi:hypothetical protein